MKPMTPVHSQPTTVFPPPSSRQDSWSPRCLVAVLPADGSQPTGGELESLLRSRLRVAVLIVMVPFVYYFLKHRIEPGPNFYGADTLNQAHIGFMVLGVAATAL